MFDYLAAEGCESKTKQRILEPLPLAAQAKIARALIDNPLTYRVPTAPTGFSCTPVDLQRLFKIARITFAVCKISERRATCQDGFIQR